MSKSLIQTSNISQQTVAVGSDISLGSVLRRFGCNCRLNGNAIELVGEGYYTIDVDVTATPTATGNVTVSVLKNGVVIPGATATNSVSTVGNSTTLPINTTVRLGCKCDGASSITVVLVAGAGVVNNISVRVVKV
jgi:hypothetical protein